MSIITKLKVKKWLRKGLVLGQNVEIERGCSIDPSFPWLIEIGNNVTLAPEVCILSHDASMKYSNGKTKLGRVKIGDNVFIGTKSVILPGVYIGNNSIIGASSVVASNIPDNSVVCGSPARIISTTEQFKKKNEEKILNSLNIERNRILAEDNEYQKYVLEKLDGMAFGYIDYK